MKSDFQSTVVLEDLETEEESQLFELMDKILQIGLDNVSSLFVLFPESDTNKTSKDIITKIEKTCIIEVKSLQWYDIIVKNQNLYTCKKDAPKINAIRRLVQT